ncbi:hypothetical protein WQ57_10195 [Mesobacillus campisalis]|uniref:DUF4260 domain-containing protein n=1 Tax=Mesobacillus campisalis TaxID=1408103 RepID=A0A0M2SVH3_9BACI|nr:DUF4260 domain-containing protein [Mesobacillus campisalis]KKK38168.1 hypothetical protein WQ57_10195 [Mesobacillus campisalis]
MNKKLLHAEGMAVLALCVYLYVFFQFSWVLFLVLLFLPDLSMVGYAFNPKTGARVYNLFHTYTIPVILVILGIFLSNSTIISISLIWTAHIGMDRMLGYGLKYPTHFKDTHLNRV